MEWVDSIQRVREIDLRLAELPLGQIVVVKHKRQMMAKRCLKLGAQTRFELLGPENGPEHLKALALMEERRILSVERKQLLRGFS